jgi:response regulator of citrate/malate metabolism
MIVHSLKVLMVEDSTVLAERMREAVMQIPQFDVIGMVDSEAAAIAEIAKRRVHVVLLDLHLKQGSGFGFLRAIGDLHQKRDAMALGATHFLDKARNFEQLPEILRGIATGGPS